ncbi:ATP-binding cassette sub-family A member 5-like [Anneissia japonica]|uniref:ATP-binding cassette sub-family A member 5-like n=1 Tax=Anneissia japonica TaxID=1529436 RepID=UPI0014257AAC|nr:ATP-binding cassette sub-family A member 5-like [Anneissia japonica]
MTGFWTQTGYLIRRNVLMKWRNKRELFQEVFLPMLLLMNLATIRFSTKPETEEGIPSFPQFNLFSEYFTHTLKNPIGVAAPNSTELDALLNIARRSNKLNLKFLVYENETFLLEAESSENSNLTGPAIVFTDSFPDDLSYTIRMDRNAVPSTGDEFTNAGTCRDTSQDNLPPMYNCPAAGYLRSGFSALQVIIDHAIILMKTNNTISQVPLPDAYTEMFPKGEYPGSPTALQTTTAVYFVLAYSPFVIVLLSKIVGEKEKKLTQSLKMMGMRTGPFWTAWFIVYAVMIGVVSIFGIGFAKAIQVFPNGNFFLLWLLLMLYGISIVNLAFMLTPFFNKALTAGAFGAFLAFFLAVAYIPLGLISGIPAAVKWILCLFSPIAVSLALDSAVLLEIEHAGLTFNSFGQSEFPVYANFIMLSVDIVLYFALAVYFDNVVPGTENWLDGCSNGVDCGDVGIDGGSNGVDGGVDVIDGGSSGVDDGGISMDIYEGQITCLLGHNGAGKSTLINCLTGMMPSTSGLARIYGYDVTDPFQMDKIRTMTGICQQENTLFDYLSPREHLTIFAGLKGIPEEEIEMTVDKILKEVGLEKQGATYAKELSGGQKRKLCMGIALIGDPKVVILDEPTSGMDPYSRRSIWTLLKNKREGRVILLTTHFMDEADILADRKAIISNGKLRCYGSSLFLKNRFGIGYKLSMVTEMDCNHDAVKDVIVSKVSDAKVIRSHGMELSFQLPLKDVNLFADLFRELEAENANGVEASKSMGIQSYGVSMTTLEEVFLKIGEEADLEKEREQDGLGTEGSTNDNSGFVNIDFNMDERDTVIEVPEVVLDSSALATDPIKPSFKAQFKSLFRIFGLLVIRNPSTYVVRFIMPNIYMVIGVVMVLVIPTSNNDSLNPQKIHLSRDLYLQNLSGYPETKTELLYQNSLPTGQNISSLVSEFDRLDIKNGEMKNFSSLLSDAPHHQAVNAKNLNNFSFVAHYNDTAIHSLPILINILMNSLYGLLDSNPGNISVSSQDFPSVGSGDYTFNGAVLLALFFAVSLNLIPPYFAVDKVKDREVCYFNVTIILTNDPYLLDLKCVCHYNGLPNNMCMCHNNMWVYHINMCVCHNNTLLYYYILLIVWVSSNIQQSFLGQNISSLVSEFDRLDIKNGEMKNFSSLLSDAPHHQAVNAKNLNNFSFVAHYNDTAIHSLPILINILMNSLYGLLDSNPGNISVSSQDFPSVGSGDYTFNGAVLLALFFAISLNLIPPYFAVDKVKDRELKTRAQLRVSGVTMQTYWVTWLAIDVAFYALACLIGIIVILAFQVDAFMNAGAMITFLLLLITYLPVSTIFAYCVSFMFDSFESCQAVLPSFYSLVPTVIAVPVIVLDLTGTTGAAAAIHLVFALLFPPYAIYGGIYYIVKIYEWELLFSRADDIKAGDYFKFDAYIIPTILILLVDLVYMYFFLRWCEIMKTGGDWKDAFYCGSTDIKYSKINDDVIEDEDEDIVEERKRVKDILMNNKPSALVVSDLRREFNLRKDKKTKAEGKVKVAVRNVSLAVIPGEVLGLLGPNGAGKTSTMNVVTADIEPTKGQVRVGVNDIASSLSEAYQTMGYCPQVDPLWPDLTVREHLQAYGAIKGLSKEDAAKIGNHYMEGLKISEHADKKIKEISGGTKRKLCFALSMLGNPEIILMDEPSTGMDPASKRFLWNTIIACFKDTRGGVLTTHSMEEADAVCSRVGIMVTGQLKCLGTTQHLKDKYGGGYLLEAKLNLVAFARGAGDTTALLEDKLTKFIRHVRTFFPSAEVIECFSERVTIKVPRDEVNSLAKVFEIMQEGKSEFEIEEYSFSQSTLEQVFIEFAKQQEEIDEENEVPTQENEIHRSRRVQPKPQRQYSQISVN